MRNYTAKKILPVARDPGFYHQLYNEFPCLNFKILSSIISFHGQADLSKAVRSVITGRWLEMHLIYSTDSRMNLCCLGKNCCLVYGLSL